MTRAGSGFCICARAVLSSTSTGRSQLQTNRDFDGQPPRLAGVGRVGMVPYGIGCHEPHRAACDKHVSAGRALTAARSARTHGLRAV